MSQPPGPGVPPELPPPMSYGGYGGDLQGYRPPGPPLPTAPPGYAPSASYPPPYPPPGPSGWASTPPPVWSTPLPAGPPQRPVVVGLATTLTATASLQWVCVLSFWWLVATTGASRLSTTGTDGAIFHILNRFHYRMLDGLAWPLYLFPLASFILSFVILARRRWARLAFTATGAAAVAWSAWWLRNDLVWWIVPACYIAVTVLVLWTGAATRWYRWQPESDRPSSHTARQAF